MADPFEAYEARIKKLEGVLADVAKAFDCKPDDHTDLIEAAKLLKREAAAAPELLAALKQCREVLLHLCHNCPAFEDDAPEFNEGGIGYEACGQAIEIINKAEGRTN
jgi:hypothetical protein